MKTAHDPRHKERVRVVQDLFAWQFNNSHVFQVNKSEAIINNLQMIDKAIQQAAPEWPIDQINRADLAILRLSIYEYMLDKSIPYKVIVDEAVELAKNFGSKSSPGFINGVLGKIISNNG